ncbi:type III secretion system gatekeeper subunit SctW [Pseudomonas costantinii]|uniref:type III secretion system gatekeeper subunit SctW n=1 Tax=Pseudomonas costantinii TaxID=168469 RepID=UPI0015A490A7|nr:type III secretion system gatekeeper subunit SctW [Pseudomonas costantinii]NVZ19384.1 type III secretion system gatekeeper subunit SctW [Pseudomonas costantinii]
MKVELYQDVQVPQSLVPSKPSRAPAPETAAAVGGLADIFIQEMEANNKTLAQRSTSIGLMPTEQCAHLWSQLGHPAQATVESTARRVRTQLLQGASIEKMLDITGSDPARTYVVLQFLSAQAQSEARKIEAGLARDALTKLELRFEGQIQAALNTAMALQAAADDPQERQALRTLYYASVVTQQSLIKMMQALLGVYGGERFAIGLKVMRRALADDIASLVSSVATSKLRTLLLGLQSCGHLGGVLSNCQALIQRLNAGLEAVDLLQRLLGYTSTGIASREVQRLANEMSGGPSSESLISLNALYPVIKDLPMALWRDTQERQQALHNCLLVMDELARLERGQQQLDSKWGAQA